MDFLWVKAKEIHILYTKDLDQGNMNLEKLFMLQDFQFLVDIMKEAIV